MENQSLCGESTLKQLIKKAGLTQRELAKRIGLKEVTVNSWVAGKSYPRLDNAVIVAKQLNVDLNTLAQSIGLQVPNLPNKI